MAKNIVNELLDIIISKDENGTVRSVTKVYNGYTTINYATDIKQAFTRTEQLELIERYKDNTVLTETEKTVVSALKNVVVSPIKTEK